MCPPHIAAPTSARRSVGLGDDAWATTCSLTAAGPRESPQQSEQLVPANHGDAWIGGGQGRWSAAPGGRGCESKWGGEAGTPRFKSLKSRISNSWKHELYVRIRFLGTEILQMPRTSNYRPQNPRHAETYHSRPEPWRTCSVKGNIVNILFCEPGGFCCSYSALPL